MWHSIMRFFKSFGKKPVQKKDNVVLVNIDYQPDFFFLPTHFSGNDPIRQISERDLDLLLRWYSGVPSTPDPIWDAIMRGDEERPLPAVTDLNQAIQDMETMWLNKGNLPDAEIFKAFKPEI